MSYHTRQTEDERPRSTRRHRSSRSRELDIEVNSNGNNSVGVENDSFKTTLLDSSKGSQRSSTSANRSPMPRRKSTLIEAMSANFEKPNKEKNVPVPAKTRPNQNGDITKQTITSPDHNEDLDPSPSKKSSPSKNGTTVDKQQTDAEQSETKINTQTNEFSPHSDSTVSRFNMNPAEVIQPGETETKVETEYCRNCSNRSAPCGLIATKNMEIEEMRRKIENDDFTIAKLRKELKAIDKELQNLETENHQLKKDNKMLEDENKTMLRLIRRP
uniref:Uncharacterized protein n=1 Tax=Ciona savignyi TaxID=51511 RepID=H2YKS2_CIOSA